MSQHPIIQEWETSQMKKNMPAFKVGDSVNVHLRIIEGGKERIQVFNGVVIARKGKGVSETFSVYRQAYGSSMERVFPLHSPRIAKIEVLRSGKVRRAKLYYLRGATGKATKIREMIGNIEKEIQSPTLQEVKDGLEEVPQIEVATEKPTPSEE